MLIVLLAISAGLFCFAGNVHSQTYYERFTCSGPDGTYYESSVPCRNSYYYDRRPIVEFNFGSQDRDRYQYRDRYQDRDWNWGSSDQIGPGSERHGMGN